MGFVETFSVYLPFYSLKLTLENGRNICSSDKLVST